MILPHAHDNGPCPQPSISISTYRHWENIHVVQSALIQAVEALASDMIDPNRAQTSYIQRPSMR